MIIVKIIGGLGNQIFQYAFGRYLAEIHGTELKLDITGFEQYKLHAYSLGQFNIVENFATKEDIARLQKYRKKPSRKWFLYNTFIADNRRYVQEGSFQFIPALLETGGDAYLEGFFQTEKYFKGIEEIIRKEITVKTPLSGKDKEMADAMAQTTSVMMHIRRGDYVTDQASNHLHGTCGVEYYKKAVSIIAGKVENPHLFVFSDDHEWVKENIKLGYPTTYVDHNGADKNYEDLRLMSLCRHHVIANSSFSWWGAWLSSHPGKIVVGPKRWFQNPGKKAEVFDDVLPEGWIRL